MTTTYGEWLSGRGLSSSTVASRLRFYRGRMKAWGTLDVTPAVLVDYLSDHEGWTRCTYHAHLTSIYEWRVAEGHVDVNPMRSIRRPRQPEPRPWPLPETRLVEALGAAEPRTRAFLLLGYLAGLRASEIAKLNGKDVDQEETYVLGKGGKAAWVPTHPLVWELAQSYPRDGYWFPSPVEGREHVCAGTVTASVRSLFASLGIEGATHRTRHTFGTTLLRGGANLRVVQELMRHSSLATTARYLGVDRDEKVAAIRSLAA